MDESSEVLRQRREKAKTLADEGVELYPNDFRVSHGAGQVRQAIESCGGQMDEKVGYAMAGRVVALRSFGKAAFVHFRDYTGQLQAYIKRQEIGEAAYRVFKHIEVGDFIGVEGPLFQTRTGEWTVLAKTVRLLCKALRPLPEKYHGLRDPEKRYRQRYLDLIMDPKVRDIFFRRARLIQALREFLLEREFLEVETPMMQPIAGGAEATPFKTFHNALGRTLFLRVAPELYLKRLVIGGFERVFEINRSFRNEGVSTRHNPEFTMLEFYLAYGTYRDLMALTEEMFRHAARQVLGELQFTYQGQEIHLEGTWRRLKLTDALIELGGMDASLLRDREKLIGFAQSQEIEVKKGRRPGKILAKLFDVLVQPKLIQPTFVVDYPVEISPLARKHAGDTTVTERFELFIGGNEIANGFSELNDPVDQRARFQDQVAEREEGDEEAHLMDEDYITALEYGMPPTAGEGVGIDRLAMLLADVPSIREVILFPQLKHLGA